MTTCCDKALHKTSVGVIIEMRMLNPNNCTTPVDISSATLIRIDLKKPDTTIVQNPAVFSSTGVDGRLQIEIEPGELDQNGTYSIQAYVEGPTPSAGAGVLYSDIANFEVKGNLIDIIQ